MQLLVAGATPVDAGKTTFATGLCRVLDATGVKPRAGNDYWADHDDVLAATDDGRLYGHDATQLAAASPDDRRVEARNPVHRLWLATPGAGAGLLGRDDRAFAVDRVTRDGTDQYVVNGTVEIPAMLRRQLPLQEATVVTSLDEANEVMADLHRPAMQAVGDRLGAVTHAVVESYTDVARPLDGFEPDAVAVVEPRRCRVYDGARYAKACTVASGSAHEGRLEERVGRVVDLLDAEATVDLPALSRDERTRPAQHGYDDAYDAVLRAAHG